MGPDGLAPRECPLTLISDQGVYPLWHERCSSTWVGLLSG